MKRMIDKLLPRRVHEAVRRSDPSLWMMMGISITLVSFGLLVGSAYRAYGTYKVIDRDERAVDQLRDALANLDLTLTLSAHRSVETGDSSYQEQYRLSMDLLDSAFASATEVLDKANQGAALAQIREAHARRIRIEQQALQQAQDGDRFSAHQLLSSREYLLQKRSYVARIEQALRSLKWRQEVNAAALRWRLVHVGVYAGAGLLSTWLLILAIVRRYLGLLRKDQEILRESEENFRTLAESAGDAILIIDADGRHLFANRQAAHVSGYSVSEFLLKSISDLLDSGDRDVIEKRLNDCRAGHSGIEHHETRLICKDGSDMAVDLTAARTMWKGQTAVTVIIRDITERKRAEKAIRESEERFRTLFEAAYEGLGILEDGRIIAVNEAGARMLGYEAGDMIGRPALDIAAPESRDLVRHNIETMYERPFEVTLLRKDGTPFEAEVLGRMVHVQGRLVRMTAVRDIAERKHAEREREQLQAKLHQVQKLESLGVLAGGIAHDFNNLLAGIIGSAELAQLELPSDATANRHVERVITAAQRAAELTRQMMAYSGAARLETQAINLAQFVDELSPDLSAQLPTGISLHFEHLSRNGTTTIEADPVQLRQVVANLVANAIDAIEGGSGKIHLRTGTVAGDKMNTAETLAYHDPTNGDYVFLEVRDNGSGIRPDVKGRLFEPFFSTKFAGRGLGLSAVLGIVRSHRAAIRVASELGNGSVFTVYFPTHDQTRIARPSPSLVPPSTKSGATVLVADDDENVLHVAQMFLDRSGYTTIVAHDGREAVDAFRDSAGDIDLVLLDYAMPRLSGDQVLREIHSIRPETRVILASGYAVNDLMQLDNNSRHVAFIQKPYRLRDLERKIREMLGADGSRSTAIPSTSAT